VNSVVGTVRWGRGGVVALVVGAWVLSGVPFVAQARAAAPGGNVNPDWPHPCSFVLAPLDVARIGLCVARRAALRGSAGVGVRAFHPPREFRRRVRLVRNR
jgi:hypothetical protein